MLVNVQGIAMRCADWLDSVNQFISTAGIYPVVSNHSARQASEHDAQHRWVRQQHIEHQGESRRIGRGRIQMVLRSW